MLTIFWNAGWPVFYVPAKFSIKTAVSNDVKIETQMATKPTTIGAMRYRIQIQAPTSAKDASGYGQPVDTWTTVATVWAAKENPLSGSAEKVFGDMETSVTRTNWIIWYRDGITARHRIQEGSDSAPTYYDIMNIHEIGYRDKLLLITEKRTL